MYQSDFQPPVPGTDQEGSSLPCLESESHSHHLTKVTRLYQPSSEQAGAPSGVGNLFTAAKDKDINKEFPRMHCEPGLVMRALQASGPGLHTATK